MGTLIRYTFVMGLLLASAWAAVTIELDGRTPAEHAAARARAWMVDVAEQAKAHGRQLLDRAWDDVTAALTGRASDEEDSRRPEAAREPRRTRDDAAAQPAAVDVETQATRERVVHLERARRALEAEPSRKAPPPPDRPASAAQHDALEKHLRD